MNISIRDYRPVDLEQVNDIARAAFEQYSSDYRDWDAFFTNIGRMSELSQQGEVIVAEGDGVPVGAIVYVAPGRQRAAIFPPEWAVLRMLVVPPRVRGNGIGRMLVEESLRRAVRDKAPMVGLHTSPIMKAALALYASLGFIRDCDLPPINGVPYGRYTLALTSVNSH